MGGHRNGNSVDVAQLESTDADKDPSVEAVVDENEDNGGKSVNSPVLSTAASTAMAVAAPVVALPLNVPAKRNAARTTVAVALACASDPHSAGSNVVRRSDSKRQRRQPSGRQRISTPDGCARGDAPQDASNAEREADDEQSEAAEEGEEQGQEHEQQGDDLEPGTPPRPNTTRSQSGSRTRIIRREMRVRRADDARKRWTDPNEQGLRFAPCPPRS